MNREISHVHALRPSIRPSVPVTPFAGCNCYFLMTRAANEETWPEVEQTLDGIADLGLTVLRTWAFNDGDKWNALQTQPGVYDDRVYKGLDRVIAEAGRRGLKLQLALTNYWEEYGGMVQYVKWAHERRGPSRLSQGVSSMSELPPGPPSADDFYDNPDCQRMFHKYIKDMLMRVNTITGMQYREDPTIHSWDIANEPRCRRPEGVSILKTWIARTAAFVKMLDPNHPVTVGLEGFFGPSTPELCRANPFDTSGEGVDFVAQCSCREVDLLSFHSYPDKWLPEGTWDVGQLAWSATWVWSHMDAARRHLRSKPIMVGEFGKAGDGPERERLFHQIMLVVEHSAAHVGLMRGSCFWMVAPPGYPDHDGYTVYPVNDPAARKDPSSQPRMRHGLAAVASHGDVLKLQADSGLSSDQGAPSPTSKTVTKIAPAGDVGPSSQPPHTSNGKEGVAAAGPAAAVAGGPAKALAWALCDYHLGDDNDDEEEEAKKRGGRDASEGGRARRGDDEVAAGDQDVKEIERMVDPRPKRDGPQLPPHVGVCRLVHEHAQKMKHIARNFEEVEHQRAEEKLKALEPSCVVC